MEKQTISAVEFDRQFDNGEDISEYVDWSRARRPGLETGRINIDLPVCMLTSLDKANGVPFASPPAKKS